MIEHARIEALLSKQSLREHFELLPIDSICGRAAADSCTLPFNWNETNVIATYLAAQLQLPNIGVTYTEIFLPGEDISRPIAYSLCHVPHLLMLLDLIAERTATPIEISRAQVLLCLDILSGIELDHRALFSLTDLDIDHHVEDRRGRRGRD